MPPGPHSSRVTDAALLPGSTSATPVRKALSVAARGKRKRSIGMLASAYDVRNAPSPPDTLRVPATWSTLLSTFSQAAWARSPKRVARSVLSWAPVNRDFVTGWPTLLPSAAYRPRVKFAVSAFPLIRLISVVEACVTGKSGP